MQTTAFLLYMNTWEDMYCVTEYNCRTATCARYYPTHIKSHPHVHPHTPTQPCPHMHSCPLWRARWLRCRGSIDCIVLVLFGAMQGRSAALERWLHYRGRLQCFSAMFVLFGTMLGGWLFQRNDHYKWVTILAHFSPPSKCSQHAVRTHGLGYLRNC